LQYPARGFAHESVAALSGMAQAKDAGHFYWLSTATGEHSSVKPGCRLL